MQYTSTERQWALAFIGFNIVFQVNYFIDYNTKSASGSLILLVWFVAMGKYHMQDFFLALSQELSGRQDSYGAHHSCWAFLIALLYFGHFESIAFCTHAAYTYPMPMPIAFIGIAAIVTLLAITLRQVLANQTATATPHYAPIATAATYDDNDNPHEA